MEAGARLYAMILGYRGTQIIRTAAQLRICDELAAQSMTSSALAARLCVDPPLLHRVLRALAALGLLTEADDGRFANTEMGTLLRSDVEGSLRSTVLGMAEDSSWRAWGQLPRAVSSGGVPYERSEGRTVWDEMANDPTMAARFNSFMAGRAEIFAPHLLSLYDFSGARHIVDVGGGVGALLARILEAHPAAHGTLFDLRAGLADAAAYLRARGVEDRCTLVPGSFFDSVPAGADVYILRDILHDWPDERATEILRVCRAAMTPGAKLLVIDAVLPSRATDDPEAVTKFLYDINMFVLFGARERTEQELRAMLEATSFTTDRLLQTEPTATLVATAT
ncbi:MAG: methyltransferase [Candidatus Dormibacter sp.]